MGFPYTFAKRPTEKLGVGVSDMAFGRPSTLPLLNWTGGGRPYGRVLNALQPAQVFSPQTVVLNSLKGNGVYLSQDMLLQGLLDLKAAQAAKNGGS